MKSVCPREPANHPNVLVAVDTNTCNSAVYTQGLDCKK